MLFFEHLWSLVHTQEGETPKTRSKWTYFKSVPQPVWLTFSFLICRISQYVNGQVAYLACKTSSYMLSLSYVFSLASIHSCLFLLNKNVLEKVKCIYGQTWIIFMLLSDHKKRYRWLQMLDCHWKCNLGSIFLEFVSFQMFCNIANCWENNL